MVECCPRTLLLICELHNILQGATIKTDEETGKIIIARIMHGGAADRSGLIHVGDEVIEVNGINVEGKTPNDVLTILVRFWAPVFCFRYEFQQKHRLNNPVGSSLL